ncbi:uncharacterized protein LOC139926423 isoform X2 [Centroberyx gerrardi]
MLLTLYKMPSVNADRYCIFFLALCFMCVSSDGDRYCEKDWCETSTLAAPLGSSVLLPCSFANTSHSSPSARDSVRWMQSPDFDLVKLTSKGNITFLDPRYGRVKAFPNQCSQGVFSIRIDELQQSDLGCYRCEQDNGCLQVEVVEQAGGLSAETKLLLYNAAGFAALILLLSACCYWCVRRQWFRDESTPDYANSSFNAGISPPPEETRRETGNEQQRGAVNNQPVYDNDGYDPAIRQDNIARNHHDPAGTVHDLERNQPTQSASEPDPNRNQCNRMESQRRKQGFHRELLSRLRQASMSRHYYVNQAEMNQQAMSSQGENHHRASFWRKKAKLKSEYKNPIYNNSTDQLNKL